MSKLPRTRTRLAGIDFGTVRIGIAIADSELRLASPLEIYTRSSVQADAKRFQQLVAQELTSTFVVGLPIHLDGRESQKSVQVRKFGAWLTETTGVPVAFFDERFTTAEANELMRNAGLNARQQLLKRDMLAAQLLLQAYLDSDHERTAPPRGLDDDDEEP